MTVSFFLTLLISLSSFSQNSNWDVLSKTLLRLNSSKITFSKTARSFLLKTTKKSSGHVYLFKNFLRLEEKGKKGSQKTFLFDGKTLWSESVLGNKKIFKALVLKKSASIFLQLFKSPHLLSKEFHLSVKKFGYILKPYKKSDFKNIKIFIKKNKLSQISYEDGLGNVTVLKFLKVRKRKFKKSFFEKK